MTSCHRPTVCQVAAFGMKNYVKKVEFHSSETQNEWR